MIWLDDQWRVERRQRREAERLAWSREFLHLLPPEPPCRSTAHGHEQVRTWGGEVVARWCLA